MATILDIAFDVTTQAKRRQVAIRDLPQGLRIQLIICGGQRILSLARPAAMPSEDEISQWQRAFEVPQSAARADNHTKAEFRWTP